LRRDILSHLFIFPRVNGFMMLASLCQRRLFKESFPIVVFSLCPGPGPSLQTSSCNLLSKFLDVNQKSFRRIGLCTQPADQFLSSRIFPLPAVLHIFLSEKKSVLTDGRYHHPTTLPLLVRSIPLIIFRTFQSNQFCLGYGPWLVCFSFTFRPRFFPGFRRLFLCLFF